MLAAIFSTVEDREPSSDRVIGIYYSVRFPSGPIGIYPWHDSETPINGSLTEVVGKAIGYARAKGQAISPEFGEDIPERSRSFFEKRIDEYNAQAQRSLSP